MGYTPLSSLVFKLLDPSAYVALLMTSQPLKKAPKAVGHASLERSLK